MPIYWIVTEAEFLEPVPVLDENEEPIEEKRVCGFLMSFGCTADDQEEALRRVTDYVEEHSKDLASFDLRVEDLEVLQESELQNTIYSDQDVTAALLHDPRDWGLWYVSGRGFYGDDDDDEEFFKIEIVPAAD